MAKLHEKRPHREVITVLAEGPAYCDPELGRLTTPPEKPYTEDIAIRIGRYKLWMSRAEFIELADQMTAIAKMIRGDVVGAGDNAGTCATKTTTGPCGLPAGTSQDCGRHNGG